MTLASSARHPYTSKPTEQRSEPFPHRCLLDELVGRHGQRGRTGQQTKRGTSATGKETNAGSQAHRKDKKRKQKTGSDFMTRQACLLSHVGQRPLKQLRLDLRPLISVRLAVAFRSPFILGRSSRSPAPARRSARLRRPPKSHGDRASTPPSGAATATTISSLLLLTLYSGGLSRRLVAARSPALRRPPRTRLTGTRVRWEERGGLRRSCRASAASGLAMRLPKLSQTVYLAEGYRPAG